MQRSKKGKCADWGGGGEVFQSKLKVLLGGGRGCQHGGSKYNNTHTYRRWGGKKRGTYKRVTIDRKTTVCGKKIVGERNWGVCGEGDFKKREGRWKSSSGVLVGLTGVGQGTWVFLRGRGVCESARGKEVKTDTLGGGA